jgi:hypothetical protein
VFANARGFEDSFSRLPILNIDGVFTESVRTQRKRFLLVLFVGEDRVVDGNALGVELEAELVIFRDRLFGYQLKVEAMQAEYFVVKVLGEFDLKSLANC